MEVLRSESEALLTILEVLQYDPLYRWTISQNKLKKIQFNGIFFNELIFPLLNH